MTNAAPPAPIVVGTDGSPASEPALSFALQESQLRGTGLRAVCAYDFTARYSGLEWFAASGFHDLDTQLRDSTLEAVTKAVEEAREQSASATRSAGSRPRGSIRAWLAVRKDLAR